MPHHSFKPVMAFGLLALFACILPGAAYSCACCADFGDRQEHTAAVSDYDRDELAKLDFGKEAAFRSTIGWPDDVRGIASPSSDPYELSTTREAGKLVFALKDRSTGKTGRAVFTLPRRATKSLVDTRERNNAIGGADLYHEWRFAGAVRLEGILAEGAKRADARLFLHGRGNHCVAAQTFHAWTLTVTGKGVKFTLLGRFPSATKAASGEGAAAPKP